MLLRRIRLCQALKTSARKKSVIAVENHYKVAPTVLGDEYMGHVDCPANVDLWCATSHAANSRTIAIRALHALPVSEFHDSMNSFPVKGDSFFLAKNMSNSSCPV